MCPFCRRIREGLNEDQLISIYGDILKELFKIQSINAEECPRLLDRPFDYNTLRWETSYFLEIFLSIT